MRPFRYRILAAPGLPAPVPFITPQDLHGGLTGTYTATQSARSVFEAGTPTSHHLGTPKFRKVAVTTTLRISTISRNRQARPSLFGRASVRQYCASSHWQRVVSSGAHLMSAHDRALIMRRFLFCSAWSAARISVLKTLDFGHTGSSPVVRTKSSGMAVRTRRAAGRRSSRWEHRVSATSMPAP